MYIYVVISNYRNKKKKIDLTTRKKISCVPVTFVDGRKDVLVSRITMIFVVDWLELKIRLRLSQEQRAIQS